MLFNFGCTVCNWFREGLRLSVVVVIIPTPSIRGVIDLIRGRC
jgi:hypothetical protein